MKRAARDHSKTRHRPQSSLARLVDPLEAIVIFVAGIAAGTINTIVGSGTLITFPVLIALGYQPLVANVSNNIGLVPGSITGAYGYRRELWASESGRSSSGSFSVIGAVVGATLLLVLPSVSV